jgi:hypothetical protein
VAKREPRMLPHNVAGILREKLRQCEATIAALEQPALADGERESFSCHVIEAVRKHPPSRRAIRGVVQRFHQVTGEGFALVDHEPTTPLGLTRLPGSNLAFGPTLARQRWSRKP